MEAVLDNLTREVDALVGYINTQQQSIRIISKLKSKPEYSSLIGNLEIDTASTKIFNYNSYIISLYGVFERFIEDTLDKYLSELTKVASCYENLPESIRNNNVKKSAELLLNLDLPKNKDIDSSEVISKLYGGIANEKTSIASVAFTQHKANFRCSTISEFFKDVGVFSIHNKLKNYNPLADVILGTFDNVSNLKEELLFSKINDLAIRRNDVAHGVKNIELISPEIVIEYCFFIKYYCTALVSLLRDELCEYQMLNESIKVEKIMVIRNSILCCNASGVELNKQSKIIVRRANNYPRFLLADIKKIEVENINVDTVPLELNANVGLELSCHITSGNDFFLVT